MATLFAFPDLAERFWAEIAKRTFISVTEHFSLAQAVTVVLSPSSGESAGIMPRSDATQESWEHNLSY